jgi:hypothetical protein
MVREACFAVPSADGSSLPVATNLRPVSVYRRQETWDEEAVEAVATEFMAGIGRALLFMRSLRTVRLSHWGPQDATPVPIQEAGSAPPQIDGYDNMGLEFVGTRDFGFAASALARTT